MRGIIFSVLAAAALCQEMVPKDKRCPEGWELNGKQCARIVKEPPTVSCDSGMSYVDGKCVAFVGVSRRCPSTFTETRTTCERINETSPVFGCEDDFILTQEGLCLREIVLPDVELCPPGSVVKGDQCYMISRVDPTFSCAGNAIVQGKRCIREEEYDCTPEREDGVQQLTVDNFSSHNLRKRAKALHNAQQSKDETTHSVNYVVKAVCKRITDEPAIKTCPDGGYLDGKECVVSKPVNSVLSSGGVDQEIGELTYQCPIDYLLEVDEATGEPVCRYTETTPIEYYCAEGVLQENRCAIYREPKVGCLTGFVMLDGVCQKIETSDPIIDYTLQCEEILPTVIPDDDPCEDEPVVKVVKSRTSRRSTHHY